MEWSVIPDRLMVLRNGPPDVRAHISVTMMGITWFVSWGLRNARGNEDSWDAAKEAVENWIRLDARFIQPHTEDIE